MSDLNRMYHIHSVSRPLTDVVVTYTHAHTARGKVTLKIYAIFLRGNCHYRATQSLSSEGDDDTNHALLLIIVTNTRAAVNMSHNAAMPYFSPSLTYDIRLSNALMSNVN